MKNYFKKKSYWAGSVVIIVLLTLVLQGYAASVIRVFVNDQEINPDLPPVIVSGRTMIPLRSFLEPLGAHFIWESKTQTVTVQKGAINVVLTINRNEAKVNGVKYILEAPAAITKGRTFVPLRFLAEAFNAQVDWSSKERVIHVWENSGAGRGAIITGYYFDYRSLDSLAQNLDIITDTIHFSYQLDSSGRIKENSFFSEGVKLAADNGKGAEMLIFANNREQLKTFLDEPAAQALVIEDIFDYLQTRDFDGVNMDFEYIDKTQGPQYVAFIKAIKERIGPQYTLSISVPARASDRETWYDGYDYAALAQIADRMMVMAYDQHYSGGTAGAVAGNDWVEEVIKWMLPKIPKEKFQLGLGIYGYDWPEDGKGKSIYIQAARDLAAAKGLVIQRDETTGASYFVYLDENGISHQVWYEDREGILTKVQLMKKYQLSGLALWRLGIIPPDICDALRKTI